MYRNDKIFIQKYQIMVIFTLPLLKPRLKLHRFPDNVTDTVIFTSSRPRTQGMTEMFQILPAYRTR